MSEKQQEIQMRCPSCGSRSLFIGTGGHLTCSWLECPEPGVATAIAALKSERLVVCEHCEKTIAENAALKRGIAEHAEYDWEGNPINWCAALLTAEEQEK